MSEFNPAPHDRVVIGGEVYEVMPHPAVPTFAFGQEGRKAFVYQVAGGANGLYALKKFKQAYRVPELVEICDSLARFAAWPGLEVCYRQCLRRGPHDDALDRFPDLEYAVLMPWIAGRTWYDLVIGMTPLSTLEALTFANAAAQVLAALEESGLAHCDIAAANVIVNPTTGRAHLIDVEDLYAPGFAPPAALPAGTDGYAHKTAAEGLWGPAADRFAGAVLIAEMAAWHSAEIRKAAEEEHYFAPDELQQDGPRYQLMGRVLDQLDTRLPGLFDRAWFSDTLGDCPRMREWQEVVGDVYHRERLSRVVSDWQPLTIPKRMADAAPRPFVAPEPGPQPEEEQPEPVSTSRPPAPEPEGEAEALPEWAVPQPPASTGFKPIPPAPAPSSTERPPAKPIQAPKVGGPVTEWRPLVIPPTSSANGVAASMSVREMRPIFEVGEQPGGEQERVSERVPIVPDREEAPAEAEEEAADSGQMADRPLFVAAEEPTRRAAVLRPILSLSHVDERNRPLLVWSESPGATHYLIQEADTPTFESAREYKVKGGDTRWKPRRRRSGRLYYRVQARAGDEASGWSEVLEIRVSDS
jgi:hypothetical protein